MWLGIMRFGDEVVRLGLEESKRSGDCYLGIFEFVIVLFEGGRKSESKKGVEDETAAFWGLKGGRQPV